MAKPSRKWFDKSGPGEPLVNYGERWIEYCDNMIVDAGSPEMDEAFRNAMANRRKILPDGSMVRTQRGGINRIEAFTPQKPEEKPKVVENPLGGPLLLAIAAFEQEQTTEDFKPLVFSGWYVAEISRDGFTPSNLSIRPSQLKFVPASTNTMSDIGTPTENNDILTTKLSAIFSFNGTDYYEVNPANTKHRNVILAAGPIDESYFSTEVTDALTIEEEEFYHRIEDGGGGIPAELTGSICGNVGWTLIPGSRVVDFYYPAFPQYFEKDFPDKTLLYWWNHGTMAGAYTTSTTYPVYIRFPSVPGNLVKAADYRYSRTWSPTWPVPGLCGYDETWNYSDFQGHETIHEDSPWQPYSIPGYQTIYFGGQGIMYWESTEKNALAYVVDAGTTRSGVYGETQRQLRQDVGDFSTTARGKYPLVCVYESNIYQSGKKIKVHIDGAEYFIYEKSGSPMYPYITRNSSKYYRSLGKPSTILVGAFMKDVGNPDGNSSLVYLYSDGTNTATIEFEASTEEYYDGYAVHDGRYITYYSNAGLVATK